MDRLRASAFRSLMVCTTSRASDSKNAASEAEMRRPAAGEMCMSGLSATAILEGLSVGGGGGKSPTLTVCVR